MTLAFALGALAGVILVIFLLVEKSFGEAAMVGGASLVFLWGAAAGRRDWQRANQEREFRRGK